jgi:hypothetical protein
MAQPAQIAARAFAMRAFRAPLALVFVAAITFAEYTTLVAAFLAGL